jgi:hypothetical protein
MARFNRIKLYRGIYEDIMNKRREMSRLEKVEEKKDPETAQKMKKKIEDLEKKIAKNIEGVKKL